MAEVAQFAIGMSTVIRPRPALNGNSRNIFRILELCEIREGRRFQTNRRIDIIIFIAIGINPQVQGMKFAMRAVKRPLCSILALLTRAVLLSEAQYALGHHSR